MALSKRQTQGLTVMIILSVLLISYAIKITYDVYITRQKINEGFLLVNTIQNALNEYAQQHAGLPIEPKMDNLSFGLPKPLEMQGTYISSVTAFKDAHSDVIKLVAAINTQVIPKLENGNDELLYNPYLEFSGHYNGVKIVWQCSSNLATRYLPKYCRGS